MYSCWPPSIRLVADDMLSKFSDRFSKPLKRMCGLPPPMSPLDHTDGNGEPARSRLSSPLLEETEAEGEQTMVPCVAFASQHGYKVFSLAESRMLDDDDVRLRLVSPGHRCVPSPHGGVVFVAELCGRYPCHLVDPFTGERTPLPDLPVPLSEEEPTPFQPEPERRASTHDGFAWDWSPHGVMVARGDTAFFHETGDGGGWRPVHRSERGAHMTVNHRAGFFFVFEPRSMRTTVIDARSPDGPHSAIAPPRRRDVDAAHLVASAADVLLLVRGAGDCGVFSRVYRAAHRREGAAWEPTADIGDRAVFLDRAHGFTVRAGDRARRNCVYVATFAEKEAEGRGDPWQHGVIAHHVLLVPIAKNLAAPPEEGSEELSGCEVQGRWGAPHWIIRNSNGSS